MDVHNPSKPLRKQLRSIIEKGLARDYPMGLKIAPRIAEALESGSMPTKDAYVALFKEIEEQQKKIEQTVPLQTGADAISLSRNKTCSAARETL